MNSLHTQLIVEKVLARQVKLLLILSTETKEISVEKLAIKLNTSTKTLAFDIDELNSQLPNEISIDLRKGCGYYLNVDSFNRLNEFIRKYSDKSTLFIIITGIYTNEIHSISEWAYRLYLSEGTIRKALVTLKKIVEQYDIELDMKNINFHGKEVNIRIFFFHYFYGSQNAPQHIEPAEDIEKIFMSIKYMAQKKNAFRVHLQYRKTLMWIMIMKQRIELDYPIELDPNLIEKYKSSILYKNLEFMFSELMKENLVFELSEQEIIFICILTADVSMPYETRLQSPYYFDMLVESSIQHEINELIISVLPNFNIPIHEYKDAFLATEVYLYNEYILSELSPIFQKNYHLGIQFAKKINKPVFEKFCKLLARLKESNRLNVYYVEDLASNLSILISAYMNYDIIPGKKLLFVLNGNNVQILYTKSLIAKLEFLNVNINIVTNQTITEEFLAFEAMDIIITDVELLDISHEHKKIYISPFPTPKEWKLLIDAIIEE